MSKQELFPYCASRPKLHLKAKVQGDRNTSWFLVILHKRAAAWQFGQNSSLWQKAMLIRV